MEDIQIKIVNKIKEEDFIQLFKNACWWKKEYEGDLSFIDKMVKNSFCFVGAFDKERMIGMGRCFSDGISDAYLQDLTVLKAFRNNGIGKKIVSKLVEYLKSKHIEWIGVIAEPGSANFYDQFGFKKLNNYTPLVLINDE